MKGKVLLGEALRHAERTLNVATNAVSGLLPRVRFDEPQPSKPDALTSGTFPTTEYPIPQQPARGLSQVAREAPPARETTPSARDVAPSTRDVPPSSRRPDSVRAGAPVRITLAPPPAAEPLADQSSEAWDRCTTSYDVFADAVTRPFAEDAIQLVRLRPGSRVLDVAAGTGSFALAAARRNASVMATDFSAAMIERLDHKCRHLKVDNVQTAVMDGQALELDDGSFDIAGSLFGLMFFPDHDKGLRELVRVLRPGGQAVVAVWAPPARVDLMGLLGEAAMAAMCDPPNSSGRPHWASLMDASKLSARLRLAGFAHAHVVVVRHMWAFDSAEYLAELLPTMTPAYAELVAQMPGGQRTAFFAALAEALRQRQGEGPFALTSEGLIAVGTKAT